VVVRILIADDHEVVRTGLKKVLETRPEWEVVALAADGREAVQKALETKPDVAIVDYALPRANGIEVTRRIHSELPKTAVLIFTMHDNETLVEEAVAAGARGYVLKSDANDYLVAAVEALARHRPFFAARTSDPSSRREGSPLTRRQRQIVQLIAEGQSNKEISRSLNISLKTVETHRSEVMRRLGISSSAALVRYAVRNKLIEP
jgi:DNA-binding NarL/FixJ family response regulator